MLQRKEPSHQLSERIQSAAPSCHVSLRFISSLLQFQQHFQSVSGSTADENHLFPALHCSHPKPRLHPALGGKLPLLLSISLILGFHSTPLSNPTHCAKKTCTNAEGGRSGGLTGLLSTAGKTHLVLNHSQDSTSETDNMTSAPSLEVCIPGEKISPLALYLCNSQEVAH